MSSRRTHIEPSVCGRILALFKCIVLSIILNIMVVWGSLLSLTFVVVIG